MQVSLLSNTAEAERIIASCGKFFYSDKSILNIFDELTEENIKKIVFDLIRSENYSVLNHVTYTFSIEEED